MPWRLATRRPWGCDQRLGGMVSVTCSAAREGVREAGRASTVWSVANVAVRMVHGPNRDPARGIREQAEWDAHARSMDGLVDVGFVIIGGPVGEDAGALLLVEARDEREIHSRMSEDPWAQSELLRVGVVEPWTIWLDGRAETGPPQAVPQRRRTTVCCPLRGRSGGSRCWRCGSVCWVRAGR